MSSKRFHTKKKRRPTEKKTTATVTHGAKSLNVNMKQHQKKKLNKITTPWEKVSASLLIFFLRLSLCRCCLCLLVCEFHFSTIHSFIEAYFYVKSFSSQQLQLLIKIVGNNEQNQKPETPTVKEERERKKWNWNEFHNNSNLIMHKFFVY